MLITKIVLVIFYIIFSTLALYYINYYKPLIQQIHKNLIIFTSFTIFLIYTFFVSYLVINDKNKNWYSYINYFISGGFILFFTLALSHIFNFYNNYGSRNYLYSLLKNVGILILAICFIFGIIWLSSISRLLAIIFSILMILICISGVGYLIYNNFKERFDNIDNNFLNKILVGIFASKIYNNSKDAVNFLINSIKTTRIEILIILLIQIIILVFYLLLPSIKSLIFNDITSKKIKDMKKQKKIKFKTMYDSIENIKKINKKKKKYLGISDYIWEEILNSPDENTEENIKNILIKNSFNESNIDAATSYIKANIQPIRENISKIKQIRGEIKLLEIKEQTQDDLIKEIIKNPVYTNIRRTYSMENIDLGENNYNYSISSWFFIHNSPPNAKVTSSKDVSILNYNNKPNILFNTNKNTLKITYKIIDPEIKNELSEKVIEIYTSEKIKLQKWNNLILNYNSGTLDIFINGKLVYTVDKIFSRQNNGTITIGSDDGVDGGICNIVYFPTALNINEIRTFYHILKHKSPPII